MRHRILTANKADRRLKATKPTGLAWKSAAHAKTASADTLVGMFGGQEEKVQFRVSKRAVDKDMEKVDE